jgi:hypothetical protein
MSLTPVSSLVKMEPGTSNYKSFTQSRRSRENSLRPPIHKHTGQNYAPNRKYGELKKYRKNTNKPK